MTKNIKLFTNTKMLWFYCGLILVILAVIIYLFTNHHKTNDIVLTPAKASTSTTKQTTSTSKQPTKTATSTTTPTTTTTTTQTSTIYYPAAPTKLVGNAISPTEATLTWTASDARGGTVIGYYVIRDGVVIDKVTEAAYTDNSLSANTSYTYSVEAINNGGILSAKSTTISVQTPPVFAVALGTGTVDPPDPTQLELGDIYTFTYPITANAPGSITYEITDSYGNVMQSPTTFTFSSAGAQDITLDFMAPENWPAINGYSHSATATLEVLTPLTIDSNPVTFDWSFE